MTAALRTSGLTKRFGGLAALSDVSISLARGARHALIGPNGAGKTTFINLLTGALEPSAGEVFLGEERVTPLPQYRRVKRGLARTYQINTLFPGLTVLESVVLAVLERKGLAARWVRSVASYRAPRSCCLTSRPQEFRRPRASKCWASSRRCPPT